MDPVYAHIVEYFVKVENTQRVDRDRADTQRSVSKNVDRLRLVHAQPVTLCAPEESELEDDAPNRFDDSTRSIDPFLFVAQVHPCAAYTLQYGFRFHGGVVTASAQEDRIRAPRPRDAVGQPIKVLVTASTKQDRFVFVVGTVKHIRVPLDGRGHQRTVPAPCKHPALAIVHTGVQRNRPRVRVSHARWSRVGYVLVGAPPRVFAGLRQAANELPISRIYRVLKENVAVDLRYVGETVPTQPVFPSAFGR
jgi:hypothetical protein